MKIELPPGASVSYPAAAYAFIHQQVWVRSGVLSLTEADVQHRLETGDVQKGCDDPLWGPRKNPEAEANIGRIVAAWREAARPVLHILHDSTSPTSPLRPGQPGNLTQAGSRTARRRTRLPEDCQQRLHRHEPRSGPQASSVHGVVVVGLTTNHCVSTTVRMAGNLGFDTYLVIDATATFDRLGIDGRSRPAAEVHAAALSDLQDEFATLVTSESVIAAVRSMA